MLEEKLIVTFSNLNMKSIPQRILLVQNLKRDIITILLRIAAVIYCAFYAPKAKGKPMNL